MNTANSVAGSSYTNLHGSFPRLLLIPGIYDPALIIHLVQKKGMSSMMAAACDRRCNRAQRNEHTHVRMYMCVICVGLLRLTHVIHLIDRLLYVERKQPSIDTFLILIGTSEKSGSADISAGRRVESATTCDLFLVAGCLTVFVCMCRPEIFM